jgi:hypothetical protein
MTANPKSPPTDAQRIHDALRTKFGCAGAEQYSDIRFEEWERVLPDGTAHKLKVTFQIVGSGPTLIGVESLEHPRTRVIHPLFKGRSPAIALEFGLAGNLEKIIHKDGSELYCDPDTPNPIDRWIGPRPKG